MQLKEAKQFFDLGVITGFEAARLAMAGDSWTMCIFGKEGRSWMLMTQTGETRQFASLDTLVGVVESITGRVTSLNIKV